MVDSMTAFATRSGQGLGFAWSWDLRSVNGKGLDLRLRLPDWIAGLEQAVRAALQARMARGSLTLGLKLAREPGAAEIARIAPGALDAALILIRQVEAAAAAQGLELTTPTPVDILAMKGVLDAGATEEDTGPLRAALLADLDPLLDGFLAMRAAEGTALGTILRARLDEVAGLVEAAGAEAERRKDQMAETLRSNLARVLDNSDGADPDRVAQELALIAVKADVREELDRLGAHVTAARTLLDGDGPVGRKLDFLMQEFNREANTLCSKAQSVPLTRIGLDLKSVIDQMREQVQNVE